MFDIIEFKRFIFILANFFFEPQDLVISLLKLTRKFCQLLTQVIHSVATFLTNVCELLAASARGLVAYFIVVISAWERSDFLRFRAISITLTTLLSCLAVL